MKVSELRIGNYIEGCFTDDDDQFHLRTDIVKFLGYDPFEDFTWVEGGVLPRDEYYEFCPIPLTREWLGKFGLGYIKNACCWELGSIRLHDLSDEAKSRFRLTLAGNELTIINYVHQLQNLYFALTGKELQIQE